VTEKSGSGEPGRVIDLSVEVVGTPEQVWQAIATGPGISSWYVPTTVEEREGGETTNRFGPGAEMTIPGRVAAWDPPHRVVFDDGADGMAFEWQVEASDGGTCVVRLVNSGFLPGSPWDDQYDGMSEGWLLFLNNLQLHLAHFAGRAGVAMLPMAMWPESREAAFTRLKKELGFPATPTPNSKVAAAGDSPPLSGTVMSVDSWRLALLLDAPAPGTAILACEGAGDSTSVSVWLYLYGDEASAVAAREEPRWSEWLQAYASES
jgi:uncharacterized protein YndB with AHSA1/START domain